MFRTLRIALVATAAVTLAVTAQAGRRKPPTLAEQVAASGHLAVATITRVEKTKKAELVSYRVDRALYGKPSGRFVVTATARALIPMLGGPELRFAAGQKRLLFLTDDGPRQLLDPSFGAREWSPAAERSTAQLVPARRAVAGIETMKRYEGRAVGFGGRPGQTWKALDRVVAPKSQAWPFLRRLSRSKNPVARIAAAAGLRRTLSRPGLLRLVELLADQATAPAMEGCVVAPATVSSYARRALRAYPAARRVAVLREVAEGSLSAPGHMKAVEEELARARREAAPGRRR